MSLVIQQPTGAGLTLAKTYVGIDDPDAADYIARVEAADEAASPGVGALETATKVAIHSFVKGCKADGIWPAIKASCILAGARTLEGALVPLAGTAPNKFGTAANWNYNRKTGLQGDGSTNYLNSNRNNTADPINSKHTSIYVGTYNSADVVFMGTNASLFSASTQLVDPLANQRLGCRINSTSTAASTLTIANGLIAANRSSSSQVELRASKSSQIISSASTSPTAGDLWIYNRGGGPLAESRFAFYSIGESLDLAKLDGRVTDLITAFGAAIP